MDQLVAIYPLHLWPEQLLNLPLILLLPLGDLLLFPVRFLLLLVMHVLQYVQLWQPASFGKGRMLQGTYL